MEFSGIATVSYEQVYAGFNTTVEIGLHSYIERYGIDPALIDEYDGIDY